MGQVTVYLEAELVARMRAAAKAKNLSQSRWLADLVRERLSNEWPPEVSALAGAWREFPDPDELRASIGQDLPREEL